MSLHSPFSPASGPAGRGAAPVGRLDEIDPVARAAILCLRAWCAGGAAKAHIATEFRDVLASADAEAATRAFDALMEVTLAGARRPLIRHDLRCACLGGDENAFAQMIAAGAARDHDDALLFACTLMSGPAAFEAGRLSIALGQAFLRLARGREGAVAPTHSPEITRPH